MNSYNSTRHPFLWGSIGLITGILLYIAFGFYYRHALFWAMETFHIESIHPFFSSSSNGKIPVIIYLLCADLPEFIALYFLKTIIDYKLYDGRPNYLRVPPSVLILIASLLILSETVFEILIFIQHHENIRWTFCNFSSNRILTMIRSMPYIFSFCVIGISIAQKGGKISASVVLFLFGLFVYLIDIIINKQLQEFHHDKTLIVLPAALIASEIIPIILVGISKIVGVSCKKIIYIIISSWIISIPISYYYINQILQH